MAGRNQPSDRCNNVDVRSSSLFSSLETCVQELFEVFNVDKTNDEPVSLCLNGMISISFEYHMSAISQSNEADEDLVSVGISLVNVLRMVLNRYTNVISLSSPSSTTYQNHLMKFVVIFAILQRHMNPTQADQTITTLYLVPAFPVLALRSIINIPMSVTEIETVVPFICDIIIKWFENNSSELKSPEKLMTSVVTHWFDVIRDHKDNQLIFNTLLKVLESVFNIVNAEITEIQKWFGNSEFTDGAIVFVFEIILPKLIESNDFFTLWFILTSLILPIISNHSTTMKLFHSRLSPQVFVWWLTSLKCEGRSSSVQHITQCLSLLDSYSVPSVRKEAISKVPSIFVLLIELMNVHGRTSAIIAPVSEVLWKLCLHVPNQNLCGQCPDCFSVFIQTMQYYISDVNELENERTLEKLTLALWTICGHYNNQIAMNSFSVHFSSFIDALQVCRDKPKALSYILGLIGSLSDFINNQLVFIEIPQSVEIIAEMFLCNVDNTMVIKQACRALTGLANEKSDVASRLANVNGFGEALVDLFNASVTKLDMIKGIGKLLVAVSGGDTNLTGSYWHMLIRSRVKDIEICLKLKTDGLEFDSILCSLVLIVFHDNQQLKETFQACSDAPLQVFMNMMSDFGGYSQYTELLVQIFEEFVTPDLWNIYPPGKRRWFISALIEMLKLVSDMEEENQTERIARLLCERSSFHDTRNEVWVDSFVANVWHIVFQAMTTFSSDVTIITHLIQFCHSMVTLSTKVKGTDRVIFTMLQVVPDMAAQLFNLLLVHFESNQCAKLQGLLVRELQYVVLSSGSMGESFVIEFFDNNQNNLELLIQLIPRFPIGLGDMNNILPDSLFQFLGYIIKISHRCFAYLVSSVSLMDNVVNYIQTLPTALLEVSRLDSSYKLVESLAKDQGFANRFIDRDQMVPTLMTLLDKYCGLKDQGRLLQEFLECVDTLCQHEAVMVKLCISSLLLPKLLNIIESILTSSKGYDQANSEKIKLITYPMIIRYIAYVKSHNRLNEFRVQYGTVLDAVVSVMVGSNYYDELSLGLISMSLEYNLPLQLQFLTVNNQRETLLKNFDTAISESSWSMIDLHWRVFSMLQSNYPQESIPLVSHPVYKRGFEVTLLLLKTNDKYIDHFLVHRLLQHTSHVAILITASVNFCPVLFDILKKSRNNKSRLMNVLQKIVHVVKCPDCHKQLLAIKGFCTILIELMRDYSHDSDVLRMLGPIITNLSKYKKGASVLMANKDFPKVLSDTVVSQGSDASNVIASVLLGLLGMFRSNLEYAKVFQDDAKFLNLILECLMKEEVQECVTVLGTILEFFIVLGGKFVKNIKIQFSVTNLIQVLCKQKRNMIVCRALLRILTKDQVAGELQSCCQSLVEILIEFSAEETIATILSEWFLCWMTTIPNHRSLFPIANDYLQLLDVLETHYHDSASSRDIVKGLRVEYLQQETVSLSQYIRLFSDSRSVEVFSNPTIVDSFAMEFIQAISKYIEANDNDCITSLLSDLLDGSQFPLFCSILYDKLFKRDSFHIIRWVMNNINYSFNLTYTSVKLFNACIMEGMTTNDIQQTDFASVCIVLMPQIIQYTEQLVVTHACVDQLKLDTMTVMIELVMRIGQLLDHDINCQYRFSYMLVVNNLEPWLKNFNTDQCDHVISGMLSLIGLVVNSTKATAYDKESVEWLMNTLLPLYQTCITIRLSIMQHISFIYDCCETISDKQLLHYYEFLISSINEYRCDENEEIRKKVILWACKSLTSVSACLIKCESIDKTKLIAILLDAFSFVKAFSLNDNFTMCETLATYVSGINVTQLKAENVRVESVRHCIHRIVNCLSVSMEDATTVIAFLTNILLMLSHLLDMLHDATVEDIESIIVVLTHHYSCDIFLVSDRFVHGVLLVLKSTIHRIQFNGPMISSIHVSAILQLFSKLCQFSTITLHETLFIHSLIVQVIPYLPFSINESELETLQALFHCMLDAVQSVELDSHFVEILSNLAFVGIELRCRGISTIDSAINHVINRAVMLLDTNTAVNDMELLQTIRTISNDDPAGMKVELNDDSMSLLLSLLKSRWKEQLLVLLILNFIECTSWHTSTTSLLEILLSLLINYKHSCEAVEILCRIIDSIARDVESFDQLAGVATAVFGCTDKVLLLLVEQCQRNQSKAASLHAIVTLMNFLVQHPMEMEFTFEALERCRTEARRLSGLCNTDSNLANMLLDIAGHTPTKDSTTESAELSLSSTITSIPCADLSISALLDMNVYKGVWRRSTLVAIKIIRSKPSIAVATIKKEVEILQSLRHPRVVSLLGVCSGLSLTLEHAKSDIDSTYHGLALEFMSKGTLRNVLNTEFSIMSLNNKLQYIVDICDGLLFLHESNVYHGLLTSETVLIDSHDRAKLTGLGKQDYRKYTTNNTPESLSIVDQKNDVWSFGMIMWEIITGKKLPTGDGNSKKASKLGVFKDEITNCPSVLFSIMTQCIDTNINSRPFIKDIVETVRQLHIHECNQRSEKSRVIPDGFICPITQDIMRDPVMLMDGHSYERKAIEDWLTRSSRSPLTNEILQDRTTMFDNYALKSSIESFLKHSSEFVEMTTKKI